MPIYEYQCEKCGHVFDTLQRSSEDPLVDCPECGEPALKKLVSAPSFRHKGSGWYETDFKTGNKKNVAGGDKKPDAGSAAKAARGGSTAKKKTGDAG